MVVSLEKILGKMAPFLISKHLRESGRKAEYFIVACNEKNPKKKHPDSCHCMPVDKQTILNLFEATTPDRKNQEPTNLNLLAYSLMDQGYTVKAYALEEERLREVLV